MTVIGLTTYSEHPEEDSADTRLFAGLVAAARRHAKQRHAERRRENVS